MKKIFIAFIFLLGANIAFAGDITQISFTNEQRAVKPNEVASLTIQLQYSGDSHPTSCMLISSNSGTGEFSSSNTTWNSVDKLTINSNWTNKNFYYKDSIAGTYTIIAKVATVSCSNFTNQETPWTAEQNIIISDGSGSSTTVVESMESPTPGVGSNNSWPVEPQIFANAGEDKIAVAGADIIFTGQALGLDKKPLDGARYLWSFGDGAATEGKSVKHFYKYPGEYIAFLNVSSGEYSAGDSALIKVIPNQLKIIEANGDFIKLKNDSSATLDISGWFLRKADKLFKFPQTTLIKSGAVLTIDSSISGLSADDGKSDLLYPNGSLAISYANQINKTTIVAESIIKPEPIKPKTDFDYQNETDVFKETQIANVADSVKIDKSSNLNKWLLIVLGFGIVSGTGFVFIKNGIKK